MQVQTQRLSPVLVEFDVSIDAERVAQELEKSYQSLAKRAKISGFRPGKAPRRVLSQMFGARIAQEVAQRLMDETFPEAVSSQSVQPVTAPALEPQRLTQGQPFVYKARVEVIPSIEEVKFEGLEAQRPSVSPNAEQIQAEFEALRRANSTLEPPKDERASAKGDVVTISYEVSVEGEPIEGAGAKDFQVELGAGAILGPIEEALFGKRPGERASAQVALPAGHPHPKLRGKTCDFALEVLDVKERILPALDDDFARDLGQFADLAALEADIRERLGAQLKEESDNRLAELLVVELVKANPIPVPPSLVQRQMELTEQEILGRARREGQAATGVGEELRRQLMADSELKVRAGLLMAEIAKRQEIKIGDAEFEEGLAELAQQSGKNLAKLRAEYRAPRKREMLIGMILENKVLDIIEAKAKITDSE